MSLPIWEYITDCDKLNATGLAAAITALMDDVSSLSPDVIDDDQLTDNHVLSPLLTVDTAEVTVNTTVTARYPGWETTGWQIYATCNFGGGSIDMDATTIGAILIQASVEVYSYNNATVDVGHFAFAAIQVQTTLGNTYVFGLSESYTDSETLDDIVRAAGGVVATIARKNDSLTVTFVLAQNDLPGGDRIVDQVDLITSFNSNDGAMSIDYGPATLSAEVLQCEVIDL